MSCFTHSLAQTPAKRIQLVLSSGNTDAAASIAYQANLISVIRCLTACHVWFDGLRS